MCSQPLLSLMLFIPVNTRHGWKPKAGPSVVVFLLSTLGGVHPSSLLGHRTRSAMCYKPAHRISVGHVLTSYRVMQPQQGTLSRSYESIVPHFVACVALCLPRVYQLSSCMKWQYDDTMQPTHLFCSTISFPFSIQQRGPVCALGATLDASRYHCTLFFFFLCMCW